MDLTALSEHFVLIVMVACLVAGYVIKHSTFFKWLPNNDIPMVLAVLGAISNVIVNGFSFESIVYGALMGLSSTGFHQAFKNFVEKTDSE
jgi:hypothetical protein|nr:MAG TPA: holin [Herelleviridae sp.]